MIYIIFGLNVIMALLIASFLWNQRMALLALQEKIASIEQVTGQIIQDHPFLVHADLIVSKQLKEINNQLVSMDTQLQGLENKRDNDGGYQHALRILEMGGDREEIINSCHLSNAEAELLMNLQAYRSALKSNSPA